MNRNSTRYITINYTMFTIYTVKTVQYELPWLMWELQSHFLNSELLNSHSNQTTSILRYSLKFELQSQNLHRNKQKSQLYIFRSATPLIGRDFNPK